MLCISVGNTLDFVYHLVMVICFYVHWTCLCSPFVPLEPLCSKISLSGSKEEEGSLRTTDVTYSQSECLKTTKGPIRSQRCQGQIQKPPVFIYKTSLKWSCVWQLFSHIVGYRKRSCRCCSKDKHVHWTDWLSHFFQMLKKVKTMMKSSQKDMNRQGRKGESDRHVFDLKPKHLLAGKRKSGTTSRR